MKWTIWIWILLLCAGIPKVQAQNDATLAGMILVYTNKAEKELKNQEKVMLMQTTGHVWTKEEVEGTTDLQREFNNYLNSFRSIVCYAAQIYGFYHEIAQLTDNIDVYKRQLPVRVRDEKGELIESRSRFALVRRDDGLSDVVFYPCLLYTSSSPFSSTTTLTRLS